jgi:hypothetical protein
MCCVHILIAAVWHTSAINMRERTNEGSIDAPLLPRELLSDTSNPFFPLHVGSTLDYERLWRRRRHNCAKKRLATNI